VTHTNPELPDRCAVCREPLGAGAVSTGQKRTNNNHDVTTKYAKKNKKSQTESVEQIAEGNTSSRCTGEGVAIQSSTQAAATDVRFFKNYYFFGLLVP
jgi:hypothetical protein